MDGRRHALKAAVVVLSTVSSQLAWAYGDRNEWAARALIGSLWFAAGLVLARAATSVSPAVLLAAIAGASLAAVAVSEDDTSQGLYVLGYLGLSIVYVITAFICVSFAKLTQPSSRRRN